jgi:hypothetical protein
MGVGEIKRHGLAGAGRLASHGTLQTNPRAVEMQNNTADNGEAGFAKKCADFFSDSQYTTGL